MSIICLLAEFVFLRTVKSSYGTVSNVTAIILILIFTIFFLFELFKNPLLKRYASPLFIGYLFRVFIVFFDVFGRNIYKMPNAGGDAIMFYQFSAYFAQTGILMRDHLFIRVMGTLFKFIGTNRVYAQFLLSMLSVVAIVMMIKSLYVVGVEEHAIRKVVKIICLLPNFAMISSFFLRESTIIFLISVSLYYFVKWFVQRKELSFLVAFVFCIMASAFHSGTIAFAGGFILVRMLYNPVKRQFSFNLKSIIISFLFVFALAYLFSRYTDTLFSKMSEVESIEDIANTSDKGGSSYARFVGNSNNPINMLIFSLPRMFFFLFSPLPIVQWRDLGDVLAFCFSALYFFAVLRRAIHIRKKHMNNQYICLLIALLIVSFCCFFVFGWGCSNSGTALRHREKMTVLVTMVYAVTLHIEYTYTQREGYR